MIAAKFINPFSLAVADITVALLVMPFLMINDCKCSPDAEKALDPLTRFSSGEIIHLKFEFKL